MVRHGNLFAFDPAACDDGERFDVLAELPGCRIERIVSAGQRTPDGEWYDQAGDEWVVLIQGEAELSFADGRRLCMMPGDHVLIPAHVRHRVENTSTQPPSVWLAVHVDPEPKRPGSL